ncbi:MULTISPECIES: hypothetical protein [Cyanophyceae]|uniref:hypothetical protein n=1 Tax=Cyanophyceae TaxID=3028117 RepID=UPI0016875897|nr:hypothetical protein [Trichocoleus sp. FACHB-69]MBD1930865.1 hypothetical protein [Trichocoleus sp. FACHB-69]
MKARYPTSLRSRVSEGLAPHNSAEDRYMFLPERSLDQTLIQKGMTRPLPRFKPREADAPM